MESVLISACASDEIRLPIAQKLKTAGLSDKSHLRGCRPSVETTPRQRWNKDKVQADGESFHRNNLSFIRQSRAMRGYRQPITAIPQALNSARLNGKG